MKIMAADLFCGAGGTSTGLLGAAKALGQDIHLVAVNHWDMAIATHSANHPNVRHYNSNLSMVDPRKVVPDGKLRLLVASPECTHYSWARGGKPVSQQSRASVKYILRWITALDVEDVLIENVPEFMEWGPLHRVGPNTGKPIKKRKGEFFNHFIRKLRGLGYSVKWRVLNAADYGDPTTRKRLFIVARKGKPVTWPEPTHSKSGGRDLFGVTSRWRPAREIIDWSIKGESIFSRKKPLAPNTLRRIAAGLRKYGGLPFLIGQQSGAAPRTTNEPVPTVAGAGAISLVQPFILPFEGVHKGNAPRSIEEPLPTITSRGGGYVIEPFIVPVNHGEGDTRSYSVDDPLPTVTAFDAWGIAQPFIIAVGGPKGQGRNAHSIEEPIGSILTQDRRALVEPFLVMLNGTAEKNTKYSHRSIDDPLPTVTGSPHLGLVQPFLVQYHGTGQAMSVDEPLKTITGRDRFGLAQPLIFADKENRSYMLDIRFRMLQPHELARAMSFPPTYRFHGNREQVVKQIGNAVPVKLAQALCQSLLS